MIKNSPICALIALLLLSSLCACVSQPPACKPLQLSPSAAQPLPPPESFSRCLREILAYGQGQDRISADCSKLLQPAQTR